MLELARPHVDVRADALAFTLDEPVREPLASRRRRVAGMEVELSLLGHGHQVLAGPIVETVGQLDDLDGPLPYQLHRDVRGWSYGFVADVYRRDYADFTRAVQFLRRYLSGRDDTLAAGFPGQPDALSGVVIRQVRRGIEWRAWHTFPATRQVVSTRSRMLIG